MSFWDRRLVVLLGLTLWLALLGDACAVRPMPEPPSVDVDRMSLTEVSADTVELTGAPGAIPSGDVALRVANPAAGDRSQVWLGTSGDFVVVLRGHRSDVLYLEILRDTSDDFLIAVTGGAGTSVESAPAGPDQDGDHSPDAIDCAPTDDTVGGSRCGAPACATDADCADYQVCSQGACVTDPMACTPAAEQCGNGLDDDCDGVVDDGCPTGTACGAGTDCPAGQSCVAGNCVVCTPVPEICNGLDDDCDGVVDNGC